MRPYKPIVHLPHSIFTLPKRVKFISGIVLLYSLGWAAVTPFWSIFFQSKLPSLTQVGLLLALLPFFQVLWSLFWGNLIDRVSKRKLIAVMLLLYFPFSFVLLGLSQFWQFTTFFIYHSFISTTLWFAMETYLRSHSPKDREAESIGLFDSMSALAHVIGPIFGGLLFLGLNFNSFYTVSIFAVITFVLAIFLPDKVSEHYPGREKILFFTEIKEYFAKRELYEIGFILASFSAAGSFLAMLYPLLLKSIGANFFIIGVAWAILNVPTLFEGFFASHKRTKKGIIITIAMGGFLFLALAIFRNLPILVLVTFFLSLLLASVVPFLQGRVTALMPKPIIGELNSVNFALILLGAAVGPLVGGFMADALGVHWVFLVGFLLYAGIAILLIFSKTLNSLQKQKVEVQ